MKAKNLIKTVLSLGIVLAVASQGGAARAERLIIKGSDTMVLLGQGWAEAFMDKHRNVDISVQGGGSGTGISALINGSTDICEASRAMSGKEVSQCKERNFVPVAHTVALDGISMAINSDNPVKNLTIQELKGIYTGRIKNWKQVGGHDAPIVILSRESSSGTYVYFKQHVLDNTNYASSALLMPSTKAMSQEIKNNRNAIGYGGVAYFAGKKGIKIVSVAEREGSVPVFPSDDNVRSGKYPISRPLYLYTAGKPRSLAADFINFALSKDGQKIVERVGYVALK